MHWRVTARAPASGQSAVTELFDLVEVKNGRIASFLEFCDTALAARMMDAPATSARLTA